MNLFGTPNKISLEDQIEIFGLLGFNKELNTPIKNAFRNDNNEGCYLRAVNEYVFLYDYASDLFGNCFTVYAKYKGITYKESEHILLKMLEENKSENIEKVLITKASTKKKASFRYTANQEKSNFQYFFERGISYETLLIFNVFSVSAVEVRGVFIEVFNWTLKNPIFLYKQFSNGVRLYRPNAKKTEKWRTNNNFLQGIEQLPNKTKYLIITKSLKDVMTLYEIGFIAVGLPQENVLFDISKINTEVEVFVVLMDNDKTGQKCAKKIIEQLKSCGKQCVNIILSIRKEEKDPSDYTLKNNKDALKDVINFKLLMYEKRRKQIERKRS